MKNLTSALGKAMAFLLLFSFFIIYSCQNNATHQDPVEGLVSQKVTGEELYVSYCKICHGENGDGPMAEFLTIPPLDLKQISARRDGEFPKEQITKIIDGQTKIGAHGTSDMPIWGATFKASENLSSEDQLQEKIKLLVDYLESIQEDPKG